jgi:hypothetical protein
MKAVPKWAFATLFAEVGVESDGEMDLTGLPLSPMSYNQGISTLTTQLQHQQLTPFQERQLDAPVEAPSQHRRTPARIRMLLLSPYSHCVIDLHCFRMLERAYRFIHLVYHRSSPARSGILSLPPYITGVPLSCLVSGRPRPRSFAQFFHRSPNDSVRRTPCHNLQHNSQRIRQHSRRCRRNSQHNKLQPSSHFCRASNHG